MRTAAAILDGYLKDLGEFSDHHYHWIKLAINEARKEAIEECAKVAKVNNWQWQGEQSVSRESILSLINQIE